MSFHDLKLADPLLKVIDEVGFTVATPIQTQAIPLILERCDLRASAQTGTGKTAAYLLPLLSLLTLPRPSRSHGPRVLILVPTRELAIQVADEAVKYSKYLPKIKTVCIYGGAPYPIQNRQLSRPYEILVATPGRLIDHLERQRIDLSQLEVLVLDEADRMLDMGFVDPVEQIAAATPETRQTLLFSATMQGDVLRLSRNLLTDPREVAVSHSHEKHENIEQRLYYVDDVRHKYRLLHHLLDDPEINQAIVFTSTKRFADQLVDELYNKGCNAAALHGDMNQRQRTRTITRLREGEIRFLIATDIAARGLDVQTISHVINFDLPRSVEDYVHRIGRTGRAGASGLALSFAAGNERHLVVKIEKFTGQSLTAHTVPGMEPSSRPPRSFGGGKPEFRRGGSEGRGRPEGRGSFESRGRPPEGRGSSESRGRPPEGRSSFEGRGSSESRGRPPEGRSSFEGRGRPPEGRSSFEGRGRPPEGRGSFEGRGRPYGGGAPEGRGRPYGGGSPEGRGRPEGRSEGRSESRNWSSGPAKRKPEGAPQTFGSPRRFPKKANVSP